jgi:type I restriction-modification system DNA methylase subunit
VIAEAAERKQHGYWRIIRPDVVELMLALAGDLSSAVHDPHCEIGTLLLAVARSGGDGWLAGDCENDHEHLVAVLRLMIHGVQADVRRENVRGPVADVVLAAPRSDWSRSAALLNRTVRALRTGSRGLHVSSHSFLVHGKDRDSRKHLVRRGVVEAVIELPHHPSEGRGDHTALWLP